MRKVVICTGGLCPATLHKRFVKPYAGSDGPGGRKVPEIMSGGTSVSKCILQKAMRYILILLILITTIDYSYAQTSNSKECAFYYDSTGNRKIYTSVDKMPAYDDSGGFPVHLVSEVTMDSIPEMSDTKGAVTFIVETDGKITNIKIIDTINAEIDKQVIDFIKCSDKWLCGYCNGSAVPVEMLIPYRFEY